MKVEPNCPQIPGLTLVLRIQMQSILLQQSTLIVALLHLQFATVASYCAKKPVPFVKFILSGSALETEVGATADRAHTCEMKSFIRSVREFGGDTNQWLLLHFLHLS